MAKKPKRVQEWKISHSPDGKSIEIELRTVGGNTAAFSIDTGPVLSEFTGRMIEQAQIAAALSGPPEPKDYEFKEGVVKTFPYTVGLSVHRDPHTSEQYPMLMMDYGGCAVAVAIERELAKELLGKIADGWHPPLRPIGS